VFKEYVMTTSDDLIRAARERFNIAIEYKDAEAIHSLLAPSYHIVTGRSAQFHGADEEMTRWAAVFRTDPSAVYIRTPREIKINEAWGIAEELGNWTGRYTVDGVLVQASGVYSAKWQLTENGEWVLQVEVFTTLTCDGSCEKPDPIYK
jgi:ketosteroid isomerase-like protein